MVKHSKTISRRKNRKRHFTAPSHIRRYKMAARLSKKLRREYNVRSVPIRKDDEVIIMRGNHKESEGRVIACCRSKYSIHVERISRTNSQGESKQIPLHPSNVMITKLKIDKDRLAMLKRKEEGKVRALARLAQDPVVKQ
eukprot:GHVP01054067.1.p1 GENE.GHVP01054067.1~~GHVP01054067.1.p1  ORF type:complete len:140 (+),score=12.99 GHVP01054067.1:30-449(+)